MSFTGLYNYLMNRITVVKGKLFEGWDSPGPSTRPLPTVEPDTNEPEVRPGKKEKPKSPFAPEKPGINPEPKAGSFSNVDIELFKNIRKKRVSEAFVPGKYSEMMDPGKRKWIEENDPELAELLPTLSGKEQTYLEMITGGEYQDLVGKLEKLLGPKTLKRGVPRLVAIMFDTLSKIVKIEAPHKARLEKLALECVLGFDEFELVKESYDDGELLFDIKLEPVRINYPEEDEREKKQDLSNVEEINFEIAKELSGTSELDLKKRMANILIQGGSTLRTYLFHLVSKKLIEIDKDLPVLYGIISTITHLGYWITPFGVETEAAKGDMVGGAEQVLPEDDIYTIKVRGIIFPFLIHEIVKGIYEYLSIGEWTESEKPTTARKEVEDLIVGPGVYRKLQSYINAKDLKYLPLIQKYLLKLPMEDIKKVLAKGGEGEEIMKELLLRSKEDWGDYQRSKKETEYEETA